ncbi:MAG TPA: response regulator transcription factor [Anaerolineae bacterium]
MNEKILVIDDDDGLLKLAETALKKQDLRVLTAKSGREGLRVAFNEHPDLVLLDLMLPEMDGLEVCRRLKELSDIPIIMLTALSTESDIVKGLTTGADDYITKPFGIAELVARIQVALRRRNTSNASNRPAVLVRGPLTIDLARHKVMVNGKAVDLTPTEFHLLAHLAQNGGRVVPHRALLVEVWGPEYREQVDYLHLYIRYLRQKIECDPAHPEIIKTERGIGYYLNEE